MHTGGTAIDGYLALTIPFALFTALFARPVKMRMLGLIAAGFGLYALLMTFSRGIYLGFVLSMLAFAVISLVFIKYEIRRYPGSFSIAFVTFVGTSFVLGVLHYLGGNEALLGGITVVLAGAAIGFFQKTATGFWGLLVVPGLLLLCVGGAYLIYDGIVEFKWADRSAEQAVVATGGGACCGASRRGILPVLHASRLRDERSIRTRPEVGERAQREAPDIWLLEVDC